MKIYIREAKRMRADTSFIPELVHKAFSNITDIQAPYIDIFKELNEVFSEYDIVLERTDNNGVWKYGDAGIKQSYYASDHQIHIECVDDFAEINYIQLDYLIRVLSQIYVHESKHREQYIKNPNLGLGEDSDSYLEPPYEIEAHAADAVEGFIQIGYDPEEILQNNLWNEYAAEVESAWLYWDGYGRYDDQDSIWLAFLEAFKEEL